MSEKFEELVDEVVNEAQNVTSSFEWGSGVASAEKQLREAKEILMKEISNVESELAAAKDLITWKSPNIKPVRYGWYDCVLRIEGMDGLACTRHYFNSPEDAFVLYYGETLLFWREYIPYPKEIEDAVLAS